jgi:signal transduction histidine kinase
MNPAVKNRQARSSRFLATMFSPIPRQNTWKRYFVGFASAVLAISLRGVLEPALGHAGFYITVYVAVIFSALVAGVGPSIVTAVIGTIGVVYWFVDLRKTFLITDRRDIHGLIACLVVCPVLIALGETNRRKQLAINEAHDELDQRVRERTEELSQALRQRESAEEQLRRLTVHLMTVQDEERRKIARDLHDTAGQTLAAVKMNLAALQRSGPQRADTERLLEDIGALIDEALREIRTTSYLLHPPLLDERGFVSATRWFVDGFTKRSGIQVHCEIPDSMERLPENVELALFRLLQETMTNIHRHSGATAATVSLRSEADSLAFQVSDNGHGIPEQNLRRFRESNGTVGVGLAGMRERVRELGGEMTIRSENSGTTIDFLLSKQKFVGTSNSDGLSHKKFPPGFLPQSDATPSDTIEAARSSSHAELDIGNQAS